jgi:hypothetical protein
MRIYKELFIMSLIIALFGSYTGYKGYCLGTTELELINENYFYNKEFSRIINNYDYLRVKNYIDIDYLLIELDALIKSEEDNLIFNILRFIKLSSCEFFTLKVDSPYLIEFINRALNKIDSQTELNLTIKKISIDVVKLVGKQYEFLDGLDKLNDCEIK